MWNTSAARLKISVHSSGPGIAQMLYFPAASGCPPTAISLLSAMVVAVSAPGHHTLPEGPAARARPVVHDRHLSCAHDLGDSRVLTLRDLRRQDRRHEKKHGQLHRCSATTGFRSTPTPGISTSTMSPGASGPTPAGVPVAIRSPGSSVMAWDT